MLREKGGGVSERGRGEVREGEGGGVGERGRRGCC